MYFLLAAIALITSCLSASAQTDTVIIEKKSKPAFFKRNIKTPPDRLSLDLLGCNWIHNIPNFQTKWYSRGLNVYFMYDFKIKKTNISIAPGIGFSTSNIYHNSILVQDSSGLRFDPTARPAYDTLGYNADRYKVNRIQINYIEIPVEVRFRTRPDRLDQVWKFNVGFKAGIRVDSNVKHTINSASGTQVHMTHRFPDFNLLRIGPTLRIGYSFVNFYGFYSILGTFKTDRGPRVNEFNIGISFNGL